MTVTNKIRREYEGLETLVESKVLVGLPSNPANTPGIRHPKQEDKKMIRVVRVVIEMEMEGEPHQYRVWREIEEMEITLKGKKREYETEEEALKSAKTLLGVRLLPIINAILP